MGQVVDDRRIEARVERRERFYSRLRAKVVAFLKRRSVRAPLRDYLLLLPDLFALVIRVLRDPRIDTNLRADLLAASAYVMLPLDLVPDPLMPLGLADDTVALALIVHRLATALDDAGDELLCEHWEGEGEILDSVERILSVAHLVINPRIVMLLRSRFGRSHPGR